VSRRVAAWIAIVVATAASCVPAAQASRRLLVGVQDDAMVLQGNPTSTFGTLKDLNAKIVRINLYWGGRLGVAQRKPSDGADPDDPAYDWDVYDRAVRYASQYGIKVLFSIYRTPGWAGGGSLGNHAPRRMNDLLEFAYAAATRYSGTFVPFGDDNALPPVRMWLAWNEPNNPVWLTPQYRGRAIYSARLYKNICESIWSGVHTTNLSDETVACGATGPRGNNRARSSRPSVSPLPFMRALKKAGLKHFDAYAHHPYYSNKTQTPRSKARARANDVQLGNIGDLIKQLDKLWSGRKRVWITEYGFQTNPPDRLFGVSFARQASYVTQSVAIARANSRIDVFIWYLMRDDTSAAGWQSGFLTTSGKKKPSYRAFQRAAR
jgi:hypothetical protein